MAITPNAVNPVFGKLDGLRYGLLGLPLAFVALPMYLVLPNHYAREFGMPLATLGWILLLARLLDAFIDPFLGRLSDRLFARSAKAVLAVGGLAAMVLAAGFALLFFPPATVRVQPSYLIVWVSVMLLVTYAAFSLLTIAHQSWGAMLGGDEAKRSRIVAWREGLGLIGVILASVLPSISTPPGGFIASVAVFFIAISIGWWAWSKSQQPPKLLHQPDQAVQTAQNRIFQPFKQAAFRRLLGVFVLNGIASAVPATLVLFFIQDRLQAPKDMEALFLGSYFICAALAVPLWLRVIQRLGLARTWLLGMVLSIAVFSWATQLGAGQTTVFLLICALSGVALSADLTIPSALLAGVIADAGDRGQAEGAYFGWWNFATKLNLALAAGLTLPLLDLLGYTPGTRAPDALLSLTLVYSLLPIVIKVLAAGALYGLVMRPMLKTPHKTSLNSQTLARTP
jgi:Na+/melibiose symporter-like transporter